ncbi:trypsin 3A1-like [Cimex lectularius]|uniref:Peptidase S1 domain-containing protein n=1 Tax=Cimex lectularius TaxID=79782 RepID=A0A8I6S967_CIMLE|nr:trypsin 3A1-like [Cimex lectularius]
MSVQFLFCALLTVAAGNDLVPGDGISEDVQSFSAAVKYPFMVSLNYYKTGGHFCSGSVLSSRHVFTTCQCVVRISGGTARILDTDMFYLTIKSDRGKDDVRTPVKVIVHRGCRKQMYGWEFDFAVVRINAPINVSYSVPPAIPNDEKEMNEFYKGANECKLVDWTVNFDSMAYFTDYALRLMGNDECEKHLCSRYSIKCRIKDFRDNYVCFDGERVCPGNGGGHLFCRNKFAGIVNWTPNCNSGDPLVFSKLANIFSFYKSYREEQINDYRNLLGQVIRAFIFVCVSFCLFCGIILRKPLQQSLWINDLRSRVSIFFDKSTMD